MADFGRSAVPLDMRFFLLRDGADVWKVKVEMPATLWWDLFTLTDYPDEKEAEGFAAWIAEERWRRNNHDRRTQLTVTRVHVDIEPAREEHGA